MTAGELPQVYLFIVDANWPKSVVAAAYASLLPDEQVRVDKMCNSAKMQLVASLAVRRPLLAQVTGLPQSKLCFERNSKGKLSLQGYPDWFFNVADTAGCVVFVAAWGRSVGVDVEAVDRKIVYLDDFSTTFLSLKELECVSTLSPVMKHAWVLQSWVIKEAYTKRLGFGLSFGLNRITTDPQANYPLQAIDGQSVDELDYLSLYTDYPNYYIALSVQGAVAKRAVQVLKADDFAF